MEDTTFDPEATAAAYRFAVHWWRSLVGATEGEQWDQPGLGEWTVRELVAHGNRALSTVTDYLQGDTKDPTEIHTAADYFRIVLAEETPHLHIAARARQEAAATDDLLMATDELAEAALGEVAARPGDTVVHLFVGEMHLGQYLATRIVELVAHGLDLSRAIGLPTTPPAVATRVALAVLTDLASADDLAALVQLLTGRDAVFPLTHVLD